MMGLIWVLILIVQQNTIDSLLQRLQNKLEALSDRTNKLLTHFFTLDLSHWIYKQQTTQENLINNKKYRLNNYET